MTAAPITVPFRRSSADIEAVLVSILQQTQRVLQEAKGEAFGHRMTQPSHYARVHAALASNSAALAILGVEV